MQEAPIYYNDSLTTSNMDLSDWDAKLANGWDRVGRYFFRRQYDYVEGFNSRLEYIKAKFQLMPLRFRLDDAFSFTKSQRINQKRNKDLRCVYNSASVTEEKLLLFNAWHIARFGHLSNIEQWFAAENCPFPTMECCVYDKDRLVACSFFDSTPNSNYSTLAFYDPYEKKRSLGTFTMLLEIEFGLKNKKLYHYPGHAHYQNTMYDYKKKFNNAERFDWDMLDWVKL